MKYFTFFVLILLIFSACSEIIDDKEDLNTRIYMAGSYWENNTMKACYWIGGIRVNLETPEGFASEARAILVKNSTVYVVGNLWRWTSDSINYIACYWVNGARKDLIVPDESNYSIAFDIDVSDGRIYIAGFYYNDDNYTTFSNSRVACYWIDGERIDMTETGSQAFSITIVSDNVYMAGIYLESNSSSKACYWINGVKIDLDTPIGNDSGIFLHSFANDIFLSDGKIYVAGTVENGTQACYWIDGMRTDLYITDAYSDIFVPAIIVYDGKIYTAGSYFTYSNFNLRPRGYYSVDETIFPLDVPNNANYIRVSDFAILNGNVYTVGYYLTGPWGFEISTACYWINGIRTDLPSNTIIHSITIAEKY